MQTDEPDDGRLEIRKTERGFVRVDFKDANDEECSMQESSAIWGETLLWFGRDTVDPLMFTPGRGWSRITLPAPPAGGSILRCGRMHLTQTQVATMLPLLTYFARTGRLPTGKLTTALTEVETDEPRSNQE